MTMKYRYIALALMLCLCLSGTGTGPTALAQVLKNKMHTRGLKQFKAAVESQALRFQGSFLISVPGAKGMVALTFDDGPDSVWTPGILDILKKKMARATFFFLGKLAMVRPDIILRTSQEGHNAVSHSMTHGDWRKIDADKLLSTEIEPSFKTIDGILGSKTPRLVRPPYGAVTDNQLTLLSASGFTVVDWSIDSFDWDKKLGTPDAITERVLSMASDGDVILFHSGGGRRASTTEALPDIIDGLRKKGLEPVAMTELIAAGKLIMTTKSIGSENMSGSGENEPAHAGGNDGQFR